VVRLSTGESLHIGVDRAGPFGLSKGKVIDQLEYAQLKEESDLFRCRRKALDYLAARNRSAREIETYLAGKGYSGNHIGEVVNDLVQRRYIDDYGFALGYIRYRRGRSAVGNNLLKQELRNKGVKRELITQALRETADSEADDEELYGLARKKLDKIGPKHNRFQKLSYFLYNRGFDGAAIRRVLERLRKEEGEG